MLTSWEATDREALHLPRHYIILLCDCGLFSWLVEVRDTGLVDELSSPSSALFVSLPLTRRTRDNDCFLSAMFFLWFRLGHWVLGKIRKGDEKTDANIGRMVRGKVRSWSAAETRISTLLPLWLQHWDSVLLWLLTLFSYIGWQIKTIKTILQVRNQALPGSSLIFQFGTETR